MQPTYILKLSVLPAYYIGYGKNNKKEINDLKMSICPMNLINRTLVCVRQAISFHSIVLDPS